MNTVPAPVATYAGPAPVANYAGASLDGHVTGRGHVTRRGHTAGHVV